MTSSRHRRIPQKELVLVVAHSERNDRGALGRQLVHRNLVRLLGYAVGSGAPDAARDERALVYTSWPAGRAAAATVVVVKAPTPDATRHL